MDKQKQIEEMARDMLEYGMEKYPTGESVFTETKLREQFYRVFLTYAEYLIKNGYRKIPEGAVLKEKALEKLVSALRGQVEAYKEQVEVLKEFNKVSCEKVRKETVEKYARLVEFHSVATVDEDGVEQFTISALGLKEILHEEFGIPYDEICKEITEGKV